MPPENLLVNVHLETLSRGVEAAPDLPLHREGTLPSRKVPGPFNSPGQSSQNLVLMVRYASIVKAIPNILCCGADYQFGLKQVYSRFL